MPINSGLWPGLCGRFPQHDVPFLPQEQNEDTRRIALVLAYNGKGFAGWQIQPDAPTIQGELESALSRLCNQPVRIHGAGRTDTGVHALGQVAIFETTSRIRLEALEHGLRSMLPEGIFLRELGPVDPEFHPRFSAKGKTYNYYLRPGKDCAVFLHSLLWQVGRELDADIMARALELFVGEIDLTGFSTGVIALGLDGVRLITKAELDISDDGIWQVSITGSGFMRHTVRSIVGVVAQAAYGGIGLDGIAEMIKAGKRLHPGPKAPAVGLYQQVVYYSALPGLDRA